MATEIKFENPETGNLGRHIAGAAARNLPLVEKDRHRSDRGAVICGLGSSLQKPSVLRRVRDKAKRGWHVFAIKEAITYLRERGITVHYACNMDPQGKEVARTPIYDDVIYCIASSCHPTLFDHAIDGGARVEVFHSACGYMDSKMVPGFVLDLPPDQKAIVAQQVELATDDGFRFTPICVARVEEVEVYRRLFGIGDTCCGGFTVANRALALAKYMGFQRVVMAGVDFGWRDGGDYYAPSAAPSPCATSSCTTTGASTARTGTPGRTCWRARSMSRAGSSAAR